MGEFQLRMMKGHVVTIEEIKIQGSGGIPLVLSWSTGTDLLLLEAME
jgi:hypothetical protein